MMGILARRATNKTIAQEDIELGGGGLGWIFTVMPQVHLVVRQEIAALSTLGLRSSTHRGSDMLGIASVLQEGDSMLTAAWLDDSTLRVSLGVRTWDGEKLDWAVNLHFSGSAQTGYRCRVVTTDALTNDDVLVHADEYKEFRESIRRGLSVLRAPADDFEDVYVRGRGAALAGTVSQGQGGSIASGASWTVDADPSTVRAALAVLPGDACVEHADCWLIGTRAGPSSHVGVTVTDGPPVVVAAQVSLAEGDDLLAIVSRRLVASFVDRATDLLRKVDPSASITLGGRA